MRFSEKNEGNNTKTYTFNVKPKPSYPDLIVNSINPTSPSSVTQGDTFKFSYYIKNIGTATAGSTKAYIYVDNKKLSGWDGYDSIPSISAGSSKSDSNSFSTSSLSVGKHTLMIKADGASAVFRKK